MVKLIATLLCAACFLLIVAGQDDFDLSDALESMTKKPPPATKRPPNNPPKLYPDLKPYHDGNFDDLDLNDGKPLPPNSKPQGGNDYISNEGGNTVDSSTTAQITSPIVVVAVLLAVGTVAGYNSYKQKKLCFKPRGGAVV